MFYQPYFPQKWLSHGLGKLANCEQRWLKNMLIHGFMRLYPVNLNEANRTQIDQYTSFNDFFTRRLRPGARPINHSAESVISPVDGIIAQRGQVQDGELIQAKGRTYSLMALLAEDHLRYQQFRHGSYATLYLAPYHYHRVHMPVDGLLQQMDYVPGKLFPVNHKSTQCTEQLFARNERVICYFNTNHGGMAVILVGALNVGSMHTTWHGQVTSPDQQPQHWTYDAIPMARGDELGHFQMGSTVILLSESPLNFTPHHHYQDPIRLGEVLATQTANN